MGRVKGYFNNIPKFYRWQTFDHICFGYVVGLRTALPTMSITEAITQFLEDFGLCEDEYCFESARAAYYRIRDSLAELEMGFDREELPKSMTKNKS